MKTKINTRSGPGHSLLVLGLLLGTVTIAYAQSDTFDGTILNTSQWIIASPIIGGSVTQNDALYLTTDGQEPSHFCFSPEAFGGGPGIGLRKKLAGDFDIQVDFRDFDATYDNYTQVFFQIYQDGDFNWRGNQLHMKIIRFDSGDGLQTVAAVNGVFPIQTGTLIPPTTSGTFRIVRVGSQITSYFNGNEDMSIAAFTGPVVVSMHIGGPGNSGSVVFDNFLINSGTLIEPLLSCGCTDAIIWHQPLARNGASEDTDPSAGRTVKYRFKRGSTIPIQIHALNCDGADVTSNANVIGKVTVFGDSNCDGAIDGNGALIAFNGVGGGGGVMDKIGGHLKYNLDTKSLPTTTQCYILRVTVTDTSTGEEKFEEVLLQAK